MHSSHRRAFRAPALAVVVTLVLALGASPASAEEPFPAQLVSVNVPTQADRDRLTSLGLDLTEHGGPTYVEVVLHNAADAHELVTSGFTWTVRIPDLALRERQNNELNAAYAASVDASPLPSGRDSYRKLADYEADLRALASTNASLVRLFALSKRSLEGREIIGVEISENVSSKSDGKPVFLMMGLHHAREWPSGEHAMEFAVDLVQSYAAGNARIKGLLAKTRVLVVPVVNPDGFEQSRKWGDLVDIREVDNGGTVTVLGNPGNAYKRKNCRVADGVGTTPPGACEPSSPGGFGIGVDLNRNYGGLWGGPGASDLFADPTYRGAGPFSEPETQAVRELISARHVTTLITNHTFSNLVLRPPGIRAAGETVDEAAMKDLGARMAAQNGYRNIHGWQLYDTTGTTEDWSYNATGGYGYTFEIGPDEFHPPFSKVVDEYLGAGIWAGRGNREAYLLALETAADAAHHSVITGKAPAGAVLRLTKSFTTWSTASELDGRLAARRSCGLRLLPAGDRGRRAEGEPRLADAGRPRPVRVLPQPGWPAGGGWKLGRVRAQQGEALIELPEPGTYVLRAENFASATPSFTITAGLHGATGEDVFGGNIVESYDLTCERPDGTVLRTKLTVDRGRSAKAQSRGVSEALALTGPRWGRRFRGAPTGSVFEQGRSRQRVQGQRISGG
jgi:zinc carboxypeptidase